MAWVVSLYGGQPGPEVTDSGTTTSIPVATQPDESWQTYSNTQYAFSVRYPQGWAQGGPATNVSTVPGDNGGYTRVAIFTVPEALRQDTNLSADSSMSVDAAGGDGVCSPQWFLSDPRDESTATENGREWTVAKGGDAGAGNFYDETVYLAQIGPRCYGLRLFIHSTNIGNYDPGTVNEFDRAQLDTIFAQFRAGFTPSL